MSELSIQGIPTAWCAHLWQGGLDDYEQKPVEAVAQGVANPCRHCLELVAPGETKWIAAYRPFAEKNPYAETGPIFLHSQPCVQYRSHSLPAWFDFLDPALVRGYGSDHWIRYETGQVVRGQDLCRVAGEILRDATVAYVHIRSKFNCFQCRVDRASDS